MKTYHPNKPREKAYERPGSGNVRVGDFHLVNYLNQVFPFSVKKVNGTNFSSERENGCKGLEIVLCTPYQNAAIFTQKGVLLVGRTCGLDIQACVDFVNRRLGGNVDS